MARSARQIVEANFGGNVSRVSHLIEVYEYLDAGHVKQVQSPHNNDILRAVVVFLHAAVEEFLRSLVVWKWPERDISKLTLSKSEYAEKVLHEFGLGQAQARTLSKDLTELIARRHRIVHRGDNISDSLSDGRVTIRLTVDHVKNLIERSRSFVKNVLIEVDALGPN